MSDRIAFAFAVPTQLSLRSLSEYFKVTLPRVLTAGQREAVLLCGCEMPLIRSDTLQLLQDASIDDLKKAHSIEDSVIPLVDAT